MAKNSKSTPAPKRSGPSMHAAYPWQQAKGSYHSPMSRTDQQKATDLHNAQPSPQPASFNIPAAYEASQQELERIGQQRQAERVPNPTGHGH